MRSIVVTCLMTLLLLGGCGQKGPLYLPTEADYKRLAEREERRRAAIERARAADIEAASGRTPTNTRPDDMSQPQRRSAP
ncbi:MAG: Prokaryotic lipoprotein-attachment site [Pseudomonadota bacterium]|jgi:predicted small lipoprotein YifL